MKVFFSEFIDQELSSDFAAQYQFYFTFCEKSKRLNKSDFYEFDIPIHFRYQPPLPKQAYSNITLPMARISIIPYSLVNSKFNLQKYFYESTIDLRNSFTISSLLTEIFQYENYLRIKEDLVHQIPIGNSSLTSYISLVTCLISTVGFLMIFSEIIFKREDNKEKKN